MDEITEKWLPVVGHEGYEVSDHGRVRSVSRTFINAGGRRHRVTGRVLKGGLDTYGYPIVSLHGVKTRTVHQLVLEAFCGPKPLGMQTRHLNDVKTDNRLINLAYGTQSENEQDKLRNGLHPWASATHCTREHLLVPPNLRTKKLHDLGHRHCLACSRALRNFPLSVTPSIQEISDAYYEIIMSPILAEIDRNHCQRQHRLLGDNLCRGQLLNGVRACRACSRAHAYVHSHEGFALQTVSDWYYAKHMQGNPPGYHEPGAWTNRAQPPPSASDESAPPLKRGLS